jgi:hypothetical protein
MAGEFSTVHIVIDALDECSELGEMLQMLHDIQQLNMKNVHILVTSRQLPEIESSLSELTTDRLFLKGPGVDHDIMLYIVERLKSDQKLTKWPPGIQEEIRIMLGRGACGM